jgi:DNA-binding CsgD family transcriptional regulator
MSYKPACSDLHDPDAAEITRFGLTSLRASAAIFFWVDGPFAMADIQLEGLHKQFFDQYAAQMVNLDPQHVSKMETNGQSVAQFLKPGCKNTSQTELYGNFLGRHGIVDVIDLLFYSEGTPVAGLGLMKRPNDPPFRRDEFETAAALQRFIEYNLRRHSRVAQRRLRNLLLQNYQLTRREAEVAELAAQGHTNADIAGTLRMSLPTVKTHLLHIMGKTESTNRTHLAATLAKVMN